MILVNSETKRLLSAKTLSLTRDNFAVCHPAFVPRISSICFNAVNKVQHTTSTSFNHPKKVGNAFLFLQGINLLNWGYNRDICGINWLAPA